jgi:hypothetical protein
MFHNFQTLCILITLKSTVSVCARCKVDTHRSGDRETLIVCLWISGFGCECAKQSAKEPLLPENPPSNSMAFNRLPFQTLEWSLARELNPSIGHLVPPKASIFNALDNKLLYSNTYHFWELYPRPPTQISWRKNPTKIPITILPEINRSKTQSR